MGKNRLLIVFTGVIIQLLLASCTYDYFKDETNYQVYVPEVVDNKVSDCRVLVYDETGKEYIDMGSGIGVTAFGIADDVWKAAVTEQLGKLQHM
ncbi:MAG: hypothetical protein IJO84_05720, partial [Butyricimonas sp.]|nr:hypothetical protein [Butyricimonas sp.]